MAGLAALILVRGLTLAGLRDAVHDTLRLHGFTPTVTAGSHGINVGRLALNVAGKPLDTPGLWVAGSTDAAPDPSPVFLTWDRIQIVPTWTPAWWRPSVARLLVQNAEVHVVSADAAARRTAHLLASLLGVPSLSGSDIVLRAASLWVNPTVANAPFVLRDVNGVLRAKTPTVEPGPGAATLTWTGQLSGRDAAGAAVHLQCDISLVGARPPAFGVAINLRAAVRSATALGRLQVEGPVAAPTWTWDLAAP